MSIMSQEPKAIFRLKKIKTFAHLKVAWEHNARGQNPRAGGEREAPPNHGPKDGGGDWTKALCNTQHQTKDPLQKAKERLRAVGLLREEPHQYKETVTEPDGRKHKTPAVDFQEVSGVRKNAVVAIEVLMGMSPEAHMATTRDPKQLAAWIKASEAMLEKHWGKENIVSVSYHGNEKTPHLHALVLPLRDTGKTYATGRRTAWNLDARTLTNRGRLVQMQDDYAAACAPFGLTRGQAGSRAKHIPQKRVYESHADAEAAAHKAAEGLQFLQPSTENCKTPEDYWSKVAAQNAETKKQIAELKAAPLAPVLAAQRAKELELERTEKKAWKTEAELTKEQLKQQTAQLRQIPLPQVLAALGAAKKEVKGGNEIWETQKGKVSVKGEKFSIDWEGGRGGGGAIDLVCQLEGVPFAEAVGILRDKFGEAATTGALLQHSKEAAAAAPKPTFADQLDRYAKPTNDPLKIQQAKDYLRSRGLDPAKTEELFAAEKIWVNDYGSLCFGHFSGPQKELKAVSIRGVGNDYKQCIGAKNEAFFSVWGEAQNRATLAICESPIDALTVAQLTGCPSISTAGCHCPPALLSTLQAQGVKNILWAYDSDEAGRKGAAQGHAAAKAIGLNSKLFWPEQDRPSTAGAKDWNQALTRAVEGGVKFVARLLQGVSEMLSTLGDYTPPQNMLEALEAEQTRPPEGFRR